MKKHNKEIATPSKSQVVESKDDYYSSSSEGEDEREIETALADVTFEELQKARSDGSHLVHLRLSKEKKAGRANKNRPMEVSCKKPVSRFREVVQVPKKVVAHDPRFESLCDKFDAEGFKKRYNFLVEDIIPTEKKGLKKRLKKFKDPEDIDRLNNIYLFEKQLNSKSAQQTDAAILVEHKKKEREAAKQGKRPFYLKKSEIRKQRLIEKYNKLKASGKLESFIEKRRKKNAAKDHRYIPYRR